MSRAHSYDKLLQVSRVVCLVATLLTPLVLSSAAFADDSRAQALQLLEDGKKAYQAGRFEQAVSLLERAHQLHPEPVLLYNLARAREGLGQFDTAVIAYERYLQEAGEIPDRGAIEGRVASLKRDIEEKKNLAAERDAALEQTVSKKDAKGPPAGVERDSKSPSPWPWVIAGVGVAGLSVGGALGGVALGTNSEAEAEPVQAEAFRLRRDAEDLALGATIAFIAGGVVLGGGAIWGIVDLTSGSATQPTVALFVRPGRVGCSGTF